MALPSDRITPSEMLHHFGLERSLNATATAYATAATSERAASVAAVNPPSANVTAIARSRAQSSSGVSPHGPSTAAATAHSIVAIDSKIEQAMDLVKTHLMFAVREEVEHLRSRIMELETAVVHLEAENNVLREHVPNDILHTLSLQPNASQSSGQAATN